METMEILVLTNIPEKPIATFQYSEKKLFETMLARFYKWEREGKLSVVDVRKAEYKI